MIGAMLDARKKSKMAEEGAVGGASGASKWGAGDCTGVGEDTLKLRVAV